MVGVSTSAGSCQDPSSVTAIQAIPWIAIILLAQVRSKLEKILAYYKCFVIDVDATNTTHGCQDIGNSTKGTYERSCSDGYLLNADRRTCTGE